MLEIVDEFFSCLNKNGIPYVHFKSNEHLDESVIGKTDFDILFDRVYQVKIEHIYGDLGFKRVYSCDILSYPGVEDWLGFDEKTGSLIHIHHHYHLITGKAFVKENELPWTKIALESAGFYHPDFHNIKVSSAEFEMILLLTRIILKHGIVKSFGKDDTAEIEYLEEKLDKQKLMEVVEACFPGMNTGKTVKLVSGIMAGDYFSAAVPLIYEELRRMRSSIRSDSSGFSIFLKSNVYKIRYYKNLLLKKKFGKWNLLSRKQPAEGGFIIAFIGCDGSGKTTISNMIAKWLSWKLDVGQVYLGSGDNYHNLYKSLRSLAVKALRKGKTKSATESASTRQRPKEEKIKSNPVIIRLENRQKVRVARRVNRNLKKINTYRMSGGVVVLDRYPQIQFDGIYDGLKVEKKYTRFRKKEEKLLNEVISIQPDLVFKLIISPEVSLSRKPGDDENLIRRKVRITKDLRFEKSIVLEIDGTQDFEQEILEIKKYIWNLL